MNKSAGKGLVAGGSASMKSKRSVLANRFAVILDNLGKRSIRARLAQVNLPWPGWNSLRRYHGTAVRAESNLETTSKVLGNAKAVADRPQMEAS